MTKSPIEFSPGRFRMRGWKTQQIFNYIFLIFSHLPCFRQLLNLYLKIFFNPHTTTVYRFVLVYRLNEGNILKKKKQLNERLFRDSCISHLNKRVTHTHSDAQRWRKEVEWRPKRNRGTPSSPWRISIIAWGSHRALEWEQFVYLQFFASCVEWL